MSDLTVIVVKNNVPKVVEVTERVKCFIEKAYYDQTEDEEPEQLAQNVL